MGIASGKQEQMILFPAGAKGIEIDYVFRGTKNIVTMFAVLNKSWMNRQRPCGQSLGGF